MADACTTVARPARVAAGCDGGRTSSRTTRPPVRGAAAPRIPATCQPASYRRGRRPRPCRPVAQGGDTVVAVPQDTSAAAADTVRAHDGGQHEDFARIDPVRILDDVRVETVD